MAPRWLQGSVEQLNSWSINAMVNFELRHSLAEEHKKLRFICRKGAVENDAIRWWRDEAEFADYVDRVRPEGYKHGQLKKDKKNAEVYAIKRFAKDILPVVDVLEKAVAIEDQTYEQLLEGV